MSHSTSSHPELAHLPLLTPCSDDPNVYNDLASFSPVDHDLKESEQTLSRSAPSSGSSAVDNLSVPPPAYYTVILPPQIIVAYNDHTDIQTAWGREGIARLGYYGFAQAAFDAFVLHPSHAPRWSFSLFGKSEYSLFWETYDYLREDFVARAKFVPEFAVQSGASGGSMACGGPGRASAGTIILQPVGWAEVVRNLVSIRVVYSLPLEFPGKAQLGKWLRRASSKS
ncbi:hypothetical protein C8Q73DRAFT_665398 [Cubamyces lactineus]|nr:hypothetical protein C8Q73DRAFT_665398 [Cubamyces lactineus]